MNRLPMFPLQSVLLPHLPLPLRVFEPRYLEMLDVVLAADEPTLGVVLIERGSEVGGGDVRSRLGTAAKVVEVGTAPDGMRHVLAVGDRRIEVVEWLADDPYPVAVVEERPEGAWTGATDAALGDADDAVWRVLGLQAELGESFVPPRDALSPDPATRAWQLAAVVPIPLLDRHGLLALDDPTERLRRLAELAADAGEVLALRLRGL